MLSRSDKSFEKKQPIIAPDADIFNNERIGPIEGLRRIVIGLNGTTADAMLLSRSNATGGASEPPGDRKNPKTHTF